MVDKSQLYGLAMPMACFASVVRIYTNIEQYSGGSGPSSHNVCGEHDAELN